MALYHFISDHNPDLVLVQEIMGVGHALHNFLEISLKGWSFTGLYSLGNSRGLIYGWHESIHVTIFFVVSLGLALKVNVKGLNKSFKVLNDYGPYVDKCYYWEKKIQLYFYSGAEPHFQWGS